MSQLVHVFSMVDLSLCNQTRVFSVLVMVICLKKIKLVLFTNEKFLLLFSESFFHLKQNLCKWIFEKVSMDGISNDVIVLKINFHS